MTAKIINKINNKNVKVGVIGLGYVGLPLALRFSEVGIKTIGFDIDLEKVIKLNSGKTYIKHIDTQQVKSALTNGFKATNDFKHIANVEAIIICVPTPLDVNHEPDLSYIKNTLVAIKTHLQENQLLVLESTTYPGTTEEEIVPVIRSINKSSSNNEFKSTSSTSLGKGRFTIGKNYFIGYSPEREDPGNKSFTTKTIPKVVSGVTQNCLELTKTLYDQIVDKTVPVSSPKVAEMTKILENIHRAVNIGLVNELKMVADKMDIDIYEVINAAATKPFGFTPYYPGPGLGGHCIPIDPFYLTWKAKEYGIHTRFIELAGEINDSMPEWVVGKASEALAKKGKDLSGAKVLILGVAYKKNVDDIRETPSFRIIELLQEKKARVDYHDPYVQQLHHTRKYAYQMSSVNISAEKLMEYNLVILATDHDSFDYDLILQNAKCIIDTRGRYRHNKSVVSA